MGIVDLLKRSFIAFSRFQFVLIFQMLKNRCDANAQLIQYIIDSSPEKKKKNSPTDDYFFSTVCNLWTTSLTCTSS